MRMSLPTVRGLAASVAAEEGGTLDLVGTTPAEGSADYVEVVFGGRASSDTPERVVVTVKRRTTEDEVTQTLRHGLRAHRRKKA